MAILGTKKFWKPSPGSSLTQKENQILKNTGYINVQLRTVNYMSVGNFWQSIFGGKDSIALATSLKYQSGIDTIEATSVQDIRKVKVNQKYNFGIQRNIAVKIPANADAISIEVKMTAIKDDSLQSKFDMLNKTEYQAALQLAPTVVGQVLTITSLVKKLFTDSDPQDQLEAGYAGIISAQKEDNPVSNGKLTNGLLIIISTNDGDQFNNVDETKFELRGDSLYYNNKQVENTYIVFNISFEQLKGDDEKANWYKKYYEALSNLEKIHLAADQTEIAKIYSDSKTMWIEGNALLDADSTYINKEKVQIKNAAISSIQEKHKSLVTVEVPISFSNTNEILKGLTGSSSFHTVELALPTTGSFLNAQFKIDPSMPLTDFFQEDFENIHDISGMLAEDKNSYIKDLKDNDLQFKLGDI